MKKISFVIIVCFTFLFVNSYAQEDSDAQQDTMVQTSFNEGDLIFQGGIPFGTYGYGYVGSRTGFSLPLTASLEYGISENISAGPYVGFARWAYQGYSDYKYAWTFLSLGVRGSFHYLPYFNDMFDMDVDESKYDFYITLIAGLEIRNYSSNSDNYDDFYDNDTRGVFGPVLGFKYYFNPSFGLYFEGGRGAFGYGTIGVSLKL